MGIRHLSIRATLSPRRKGGTVLPRKLPVLVSVVLLLALVVPTTALGDRTWVVKNASGKKIGTVRLFSKAREGGIIARVNNNAGVRRGFLYRKVDGGYLAAMATPKDTAPRAYLQTRRYSSNAEWDLYSLNNWEHPTYVGRVIKHSGRWYPQTMGDFYHNMGSLPDSAPAWVASGSVFCLHSWWWTWP